MNEFGKRKWVGIIVVLAASILSAQAQDWAFTDGFEGIPAGGDPDSNIWNYASFWETAAGTNFIEVQSSIVGVDEGTNYVRLSMRPGEYLERAWDGSCCDGEPVVNLGGISQIQQDFVWQFAFRVADNSAGFRAFIGRRSSPAGLGLLQGIGVGVDAGNLTRFFGNVESSLGVPIANDRWYTVTIDADWDIVPQRYDLYLDGVLVTNVQFNNMFANGFQSVHLIADADGVDLDSFFLDDFNPLTNDVVVITEVEIEDTTGFTFPSTLGVDYQLQITTNVLSGIWFDLDFTLHGTGETMSTFDPAGFNPLKSYRLIVLP